MKVTWMWSLSKYLNALYSPFTILRCDDKLPVCWDEVSDARVAMPNVAASDVLWSLTFWQWVRRRSTCFQSCWLQVIGTVEIGAVEKGNCCHPYLNFPNCCPQSLCFIYFWIQNPIKVYNTVCGCCVWFGWCVSFDPELPRPSFFFFFLNDILFSQYPGQLP